MRVAWRFIALAATSLTLLAVVYGLAYGTEFGARADAAARSGLDTPGHDIDFFLSSVVIVLILTLVAISAAIVRGRRLAGASATVALCGAALSAFVLREGLGRLDPLHGDAVRGLDMAFPSMHTAVAAAAAIAAFLLASPRSRLGASIGASAYATAVGIASVVAGGHHPSDVIGAYLLVGIWAGIAGAAIALGRTRRAQEPVPPRTNPGAAGALLVAAGISVGAVLAVCAITLESWSSTHASSVACVVALVGIPPLLLAVLTGSLDRLDPLPATRRMPKRSEADALESRA